MAGAWLCADNSKNAKGAPVHTTVLPDCYALGRSVPHVQSGMTELAFSLAALHELGPGHQYGWGLFHSRLSDTEPTNVPKAIMISRPMQSGVGRSAAPVIPADECTAPSRNGWGLPYLDVRLCGKHPIQGSKTYPKSTET